MPGSAWHSLARAVHAVHRHVSFRCQARAVQCLALRGTCQAPFPFGAGEHPKHPSPLMTRTRLSDFPLDRIARVRIVRASMTTVLFAIKRHATHMCMHTQMHKHMSFAAPWAS